MWYPAPVPRWQALHDNWKQLIMADRGPTALLWVGSEGVGKTPIALAFIQARLCEEGKGLYACGQCYACRTMEKLQTPQLFLIPPLPTNPSCPLEDGVEWLRRALIANPFLTLAYWEEEVIRSLQDKSAGTKREKKNARRKGEYPISVEVVRQVQDWLKLKPTAQEWRVVLFWHAEQLTRQAANALLKIVEEPPAHTMFMFLATHREALPATLRSRCQTWYFPPLSPTELEQLSGTKLSDEEIILAEGSYAKLRALREESQQKYLRALRTWIEALHPQTPWRSEVEEAIEILSQHPYLSDWLIMGVRLARKIGTNPSFNALIADRLLHIADAVDANISPTGLLWEVTLELRQSRGLGEFRWEWLHS
ncbi:MAG: hypothetical protein NZ580_05120 [Bacteroidia bacterium]|nr:hypothetical protein [Bacteroidia bacterium]MDW8236191.1 hypothetical protein [Bacteroidia bacterium]